MKTINRNNPLYVAYMIEKTLETANGYAVKIPALWDEKRARVTRDNEKTGIPSFSLLAGARGDIYRGNVPAGLEALKECGGTCSGRCPGCYAEKTTRYPAPLVKLALNTLEAKSNPRRFIELVERELFTGNALTAPRVVRLHDSGDFFNLEYFRACLDMITRHPETRFGTYTKEARTVNRYGLENLPENLILSCSPWKGVSKPIGNLPQFIYDDGTDAEIAALPHCPAVNKKGEKTGVKCCQCLHCYTAENGARWAVYPH